ncbi:MAG: hypothetical protein EXR71_19980 [Myxococcales bacterium]|nr:hypothetical protein [Myxococcales bacterium]
MPSSLRIRPPAIVVTSIALSLLAGCTPASDRFYVTDNFSNEFLSSSDNVADSYAVGSVLTFEVGQTLILGRHVDMQGWALVSSDPSVVEVTVAHGDETSISAEGAAVGSGSAALMVVDETGATIHEVAVEVAVPDGVSLVSKLGTDVGSGFEPTTPQKICVGSYSAFEARFEAGGRSLGSSHVLGAEGSETVTVRVEDSHLWESREWLSVWPTLEGDELISVQANGSDLEDVVFTAVAVESIVGLQVLGNTSAVGASNDDTVIIGAVGLDAEGSQVLGVTPTWIMPDGTEMVGDELSFTADLSSPPIDITVRFGSVSALVAVSGDPTSASASADIDCSSAPGFPGLGLALAGLCALITRRRG